MPDWRIPVKNAIRFLWRMIYPMLIYFGAMVVIELLFSIGYVIGAGMPEDSLELTEMLVDFLTRSSFIITTVMNFVLVPIFALIYRADSRKLAAKGMLPASEIKITNYLVLAVLGICSAVGMNGVITISGIEAFSDTYQEVSETIYSGGLILEIVSAGIAAPFAEELLFRGLIHRRIKEYVPQSVAMIISALVFGAFHGNLVQFVYAFTIGLLLAYVYDKYNTIWASICFHVAANMISVLITELLPEQYYTVWVVLFATVTGLIGTYFCLVNIRGKRFFAASDKLEE